MEPPVFFQIAFVQHQVVRGGLAGDVYAPRLRRADERDALFRRNMADVIFRARFLRDSQIALDLKVLAFRRNPPVPAHARILPVVDITAAEQFVHFAVRGDDHAFPLRLLHGAPHDGFALNAPAVVRKSDGIGF